MLKLAQEGAQIAVHYNQNQEAAEQRLAGLPEDAHHIFQAHIADAKGVEEMTATVIDQMGGLQIVVNNAPSTSGNRP